MVNTERAKQAKKMFRNKQILGIMRLFLVKCY